ncbi:MAG: hypothetical protein Q8787_02855, partial [Sweet potato little leaf phytoplasma]|nr:hypothetical protein [Sweet potato little leaf phytoplasma]
EELNNIIPEETLVQTKVFHSGQEAEEFFVEDNAKPTETPEPEPTEEPEAEPTEEPEAEPTEEPAEPEMTEEPSTETPTTEEGPLETGTGNMVMITGAPSLVTGTGTASSGWPMYTGNTTFLKLAQRRPTALYL